MPNSFRVFRPIASAWAQLCGSKFRPHRIRPLSSVLRRLVPALCLLTAVLCVGTALAAGFSKTYSLSNGAVVVSNNQKRSSWHPVALLFHFTEPVDPTVSIKRLSKGEEFLLSAVTFTNVQDITWIPDADYPFNFGDSLVISTTATNGTLELIQRSDT